jgi:hypothetical protein
MAGLLLTLYILRWSLELLLIYIEVPVPNHQNTSSWFGNCSRPNVVNDHTIVNLNSSNVVNCPNVVKHPTVVNCPYKWAECSKLSNCCKW